MSMETALIANRPEAAAKLWHDLQLKVGTNTVDKEGLWCSVLETAGVTVSLN